MTAPQDIPGYTQGLIFSDQDGRYYNGSDTFYDQGPYASWGMQDCTLMAGTPSFDTSDGRRGLILDNTSHWEFLASALWEGSHMIIGKFIPTVDTATRRASLINMGGHPTFISAAGDELRRVTGRREIIGKPSSGGAAIISKRNDDDNRVVLFTASQEHRRWSLAEKAVITHGTTQAASGRGEGVAPSSYNGASNIKAIIGQTKGATGDLTAFPECAFIIYELHYWSTPIIESHPGATLACVAAKNAEYGIT